MTQREREVILEKVNSVVNRIKKMKESKPVIFGSGASSSKDFKSLYINCHAALTNGITHFDTAPSYATEEVLSQAVQRSANELGLKRSDYQIQTKIDPTRWRN